MTRRPMPVHLHIVNENKAHLSKDELERRKKAEESLQFKNDKIKPPQWLSDDAKRIFKKLIKEFEHNNLLTNVDVTSLAIYSDLYNDYIYCSKLIEEEGMMVEYTNKAAETNKVPHPLLTKKKQSFESMNKIASEFGLSPVARAKLALNLTPTKDDEESNRFSDRI